MSEQKTAYANKLRMWYEMPGHSSPLRLPASIIGRPSRAGWCKPVWDCTEPSRVRGVGAAGSDLRMLDALAGGVRKADPIRTRREPRLPSRRSGPDQNRM